MRINYLNLKEGDPVTLNQKISVFVGPNNSGKSQTLKDIRCLMDRQQANLKPVILNDDTMCFDIPDLDTIMNDIPYYDSHTNVDHYTFEFMNSNLIGKKAYDIHKPRLENYDEIPDKQKHYLFFTWFAKNYIALMDAETRLRLSSETDSFIPSEEGPQNLLQSLFMSPDIETILKNAFNEAFKQDIKLDVSQLQKICLRIGKNVNEIPEDPRTAYTIAKDIPKIDSQGDGFRSFAGIVIGLLICKKRIILLDEPEAFLHPAQAFFLGKWIGENSERLGSQVLICTHSSNFMSGILTGTKNLDIFRLHREGNRTFYDKLVPEVVNQLIGNPILSSQRVIEGIFHSGVVICEADADRAVYQSVAAICHNSNREVLFIHAHNKQTLALVADVLKKAGTPVAVIADVDILRPHKDLDNVYRVLTGEDMPADLKALQIQFDRFIESRPEEEVLNELKQNVYEFIAQIEKGDHSLEGARSALSRIKNETSKWSVIKRNGLDALNEEMPSASQLINTLSSVGLFVVPVGELEGWINLGIHKKNKWIIPALEKINNHEIPKGLSDFVARILAFFK